mmetsp:Transcript_129333/g.322412  ORF Transcript_129333/g.322412 Transcript_129333/m.322412 type:complete len:240 (-) Transcript_129333:468-1187(-)
MPILAILDQHDAKLPKTNDEFLQAVRIWRTDCLSCFTRWASRRCCNFSWRRAFFTSGPQRWQNWQAKPFSQPLVCTKAHGLQLPTACAAEPALGSSNEPKAGLDGGVQAPVISSSVGAVYIGTKSITLARGSWPLAPMGQASCWLTKPRQDCCGGKLGCGAVVPSCPKLSGCDGKLGGGIKPKCPTWTLEASCSNASDKLSTFRTSPACSLAGVRREFCTTAAVGVESVPASMPVSCPR